MYLFALLLSLSAHACPNLSAHYDCTVDGTPLGHMEFHPDFQTTENPQGHTVYTLGGKQFVTDGQQHYLDTFPGFERWVHGVNYIATCADDGSIRTRGNARIILGAVAQFDGGFQAVSDRELRGHLHVNLPIAATDAVISCVRK